MFMLIQRISSHFSWILRSIWSVSRLFFHTPTEIPLSSSKDSRYVLLISSVPEIFTDQIKFERKIQRIIPHTAPAKSPDLFLWRLIINGSPCLAVILVLTLDLRARILIFCSRKGTLRLILRSFSERDSRDSHRFCGYVHKSFGKFSACGKVHTSSEKAYYFKEHSFTSRKKVDVGYKAFNFNAGAWNALQCHSSPAKWNYGFAGINFYAFAVIEQNSRWTLNGYSAVSEHSIYGIVPISNIGEGNLSFLSAIRFFFGKKISPVFVSHLFLCNCRHIY